MSVAPFTAEEFAAALDRIGGFEARPFVAVAVSGGPDSMALALLAHAWASRRGGQAWALTVDHGLRPESAEEVRTVAGWLAARGIPHQGLVWAGDKPRTGIQEAAREARYRLLAGWCRERGCLHLMTAHHREDQAETYLIRRRARSGVDGLAGMSTVRELDGCRLVRPLLGVTRARLAALLALQGQPFLRDPSNENPAYERSRLRLEPDLLDSSGVDAAVTQSREHGRLRVEREHVLHGWLALHAMLHPAGFGMLDAIVLGASDPELAERALARIAASVGGASYRLRRIRVAGLRAGLSTAPERARTLGGCRFVPWRERILVLRELAAAEPPIRLEPRGSLLWDGRFRLSSAPTGDRAFTVGYLGQLGAAALPRTEANTASDPPRLVHPVLPAFWDSEGVAAVPALGWLRAPELVVPQLRFRPANPLANAGFTVV